MKRQTALGTYQSNKQKPISQKTQIRGIMAWIVDGNAPFNFDIVKVIEIRDRLLAGKGITTIEQNFMNEIIDGFDIPNHYFNFKYK